ncbi:hypothetical protein QO230_22405 [Vibrio vulnificus]|nr:hypothetical protein [Vibrio vulnificus]MCU8299978.1 hypothetical protein [Vibrio vulnificus]MCU8417698.1 hypothetical protein [Vibrio vulnificus]MCU8518810.1 hypothetical protein [Vibrio vulnificus]MDK2631485.1 hypothetical protein [Vibrio vulnificus]MDK2707010.1 hypothetical protein [Vibrio vulnificus]
MKVACRRLVCAAFTP